MQAITTKYLPATNTKPSRIKAACERGSITVSYDSAGSDEDAHVAAAQALVESFIVQDSAKYGSNAKSNPWNAKRVVGGLHSGGYAHVFVK
jgi:hypothetical protein